MIYQEYDRDKRVDDNNACKTAFVCARVSIPGDRYFAYKDKM